MLDVRRMRVLREVAVRGSFSAAAEALSFTQSAVSQQIAALEREAGTVLVQRNARGVRLTEAGEALVRPADAGLARLAEAEAELEAIAGLRGGRLRMASFESAGATLMPPAGPTLPERHPPGGASPPARGWPLARARRARRLGPQAQERRARDRAGLRRPRRPRCGRRLDRARPPPRPPALPGPPPG